MDGGWRELVEPSEWGLFAPVAHRAGGCELAPDIWLRLVEIEEEKEEVESGGNDSMVGITWDLDPEAVGAGVEAEMEEMEVDFGPWGWLVVFGSGFRKTGGG